MFNEFMSNLSAMTQQLKNSMNEEGKDETEEDEKEGGWIVKGKGKNKSKDRRDEKKIRFKDS